MHWRMAHGALGTPGGQRQLTVRQGVHREDGCHGQTLQELGTFLFVSISRVRLAEILTESNPPCHPRLSPAGVPRFGTYL